MHSTKRFLSLPPQHQEVEHSLVPPALLLLLLLLPLHTLPAAEVCEHLHQILGRSGEEGGSEEGGRGGREGGREGVRSEEGRE